MSDETHVAIKQTPVGDLITHFGLASQDTMPVSLAKGLIEMAQILSSHQIETETSVELIRSFELKFGKNEEPKFRVDRFLNFIRQSKEKGPLLDTVKDLGLLSKAELEEYGLETGDWSHFLRRIDKEKKK